MSSRLARRTVAFMVVLGCVATSGCVNHGSNSLTFCRKNAPLLTVDKDEQRLSKDQAVYIDDELQKTMRYSEDGTRTIRTKARKLADAYTEIRAIAGDDDVKESDFDERYGTLLERRKAMRQACREVKDA
jgi:hypothetical protein